MACIRSLIMAKLGDDYFKESGICGYNIEITKRNFLDSNRKAFDINRKAFNLQETCQKKKKF